jgi:hypothetical protein
VRGWYERGQQAAPKLAQAADATHSQAPETTRPEPTRSNGAAPPAAQTVVRPDHARA